MVHRMGILGRKARQMMPCCYFPLPMCLRQARLQSYVAWLTPLCNTCKELSFLSTEVTSWIIYAEVLANTHNISREETLQATGEATSPERKPKAEWVFRVALLLLNWAEGRNLMWSPPNPNERRELFLRGEQCKGISCEKTIPSFLE